MHSLLVFLIFLFLSPVIFFLTVSISIRIVTFWQRPKQNKEWGSLFQKLPEIVFDQKNPNTLFVKNIRNARYNPIYEFENKVEYLNKKYNLSDLKKLWIIVCPFAPFQYHTLFSFEFGTEKNTKTFLTISYELRKTLSERFSVYKTLYTRYEGFFLLATEEDTLYLRTNVRNDGPVYLYPINLGPSLLKKIFLDILREINIYNGKPFFYRILYRNCLSQVFKFLKQEKILNYNFLDFANVNRLIYKSKIVDDRDISKLDYRSFLNKYRVVKNPQLKPDENYSFLIRTG